MTIPGRKNVCLPERKITEVGIQVGRVIRARMDAKILEDLGIDEQVIEKAGSKPPGTVITKLLQHR